MDYDDLVQSNSELTQLGYTPDITFQWLELEEGTERDREIGESLPYLDSGGGSGLWLGGERRKDGQRRDKQQGMRVMMDGLVVPTVSCYY